MSVTVNLRISPLFTDDMVVESLLVVEETETFVDYFTKWFWEADLITFINVIIYNACWFTSI